MVLSDHINLAPIHNVSRVPDTLVIRPSSNFDAQFPWSRWTACAVVWSSSTDTRGIEKLLSTHKSWWRDAEKRIEKVTCVLPTVVCSIQQISFAKRERYSLRRNCVFSGLVFAFPLYNSDTVTYDGRLLW